MVRDALIFLKKVSGLKVFSADSGILEMRIGGNCKHGLIWLMIQKLMITFTLLMMIQAFTVLCAILTRRSLEHNDCSWYLHSLMAEQLCIASWNATGIMSSASYISSLLDKRRIHILGLSEHWLFNHNLHFLDSINSNYVGFGIADNDLLLNSNRRVGKGGVAILWRSSLSNYISPLDIDSDRICGVKYRLNNGCFYIIQVYAPSSNHSIHIFREFIDYYNQSFQCILKWDI